MIHRLTTIARERFCFFCGTYRANHTGSYCHECGEPIR